MSMFQTQQKSASHEHGGLAHLPGSTQQQQQCLGARAHPWYTACVCCLVTLPIPTSP